jgi:uncharacterized membrane protein
MMPDDSKKLSARAIVRRYFVTGILVLLPLAVTVWLLWRIISAVEGGVARVMERLDLTYYVGYGFLVVIAIIFAAGLFAQNVIGRKLVRFVERLVTKIPFVSKVYLTVQQIRDAFIGREHALFQNVAVIEYPSPGLYTICFVTSTAREEVQRKTEEQVVCVFVPTTPNPTSGFLIFVPEDKLIPLSMTVEEAMKLVISGGALVPKYEVDQLQGAQRVTPSESDRLSAPGES